MVQPHSETGKQVQKPGYTAHVRPSRPITLPLHHAASLPASNFGSALMVVPTSALLIEDGSVQLAVTPGSVLWVDGLRMQLFHGLARDGYGVLQFLYYLREDTVP
jgi:hypothetical protein